VLTAFREQAEGAQPSDALLLGRALNLRGPILAQQQRELEGLLDSTGADKAPPAAQAGPTFITDTTLLFPAEDQTICGHLTPASGAKGAIVRQLVRPRHLCVCVCACADPASARSAPSFCHTSSKTRISLPSRPATVVGLR
jgi:hypothetical protein